MPNDTTPAPDSGEPNNAPQDNWAERYKGLQGVLAKRDTELTALTAEQDRLRAEHEQAIADLATYRQRDVDASEEDLARQQYEQLRSRFEPEPPPTLGANPARDWASGSTQSWNDRERADGNGTGWPS